MSEKARGEALAKERKAMADVTRDLGKLQKLNLSQLRQRHLDLFGAAARSKNLPFLRKKLAWRIQELAEGGLSPAAKNLLDSLIPTKLPEKSTRKKPSSKVSPTKPGSRDARLPAPGTVLNRAYQGEAHQVEVLENGLRFRGKPHSSLSAIAKLITGTCWNGFLFFGLSNRKGTHDR